MVSETTHTQGLHGAAAQAPEQLGDGFSPPSPDAQPTLGEPDMLAAAADAGHALGSQSDF